MNTYIEKEIAKLWIDFQGYTNLVQQCFRDGIRSLEQADIQLAKEVIAIDAQIDAREIEIEENCLKILALYQPVAKDLRHIIAILKMNNRLERIADLGCSISERVLELTATQPLELLKNFTPMVSIVEDMLMKSVRSIFEKDIGIAKKVILLDEKIDDMHAENYVTAEELYSKGKYSLQDIFSLISISRFIERAADHTTTIAENVIYFLTGDIYRHRSLDDIQ